MKLVQLFEDHPDDIIPPNAYGYALGQAIGKTVAEFRQGNRKEIVSVMVVVAEDSPIVIIDGTADIGIPAAFKCNMEIFHLSPLYSIQLVDLDDDSRSYKFHLTLPVKVDLDDVERGYKTQHSDMRILTFA